MRTKPSVNSTGCWNRPEASGWASGRSTTSSRTESGRQSQAQEGLGRRSQHGVGAAHWDCWAHKVPGPRLGRVAQVALVDGPLRSLESRRTAFSRRLTRPRRRPVCTPLVFTITRAGVQDGWDGCVRAAVRTTGGSADDRCSTASAKTLRCVSGKAVAVACLSWRTPGLSGQARRDDLGQMRKPTAGVHSALAVLIDRAGRLPRSRLIPHEAEFRARRELFRRCLGIGVRALWLRAEHVDVRRAAGRMQDDDVLGPRFEVCRAAGREWLFPFGELNLGSRLVHSRFAGSSRLASSSPGVRAPRSIRWRFRVWPRTARNPVTESRGSDRKVPGRSSPLGARKTRGLEPAG